MSENKDDELKRIEITLTMEALLRDGITINTGEQLVLTVMETDESISG